VYLQAYLTTENTTYKQICEETIDFVLRELLDKQGGFYSSLDADSEGEEGKFYLWTVDEIRQVLNDNQLFKILSSAQVGTRRNFEETILRRYQSNEMSLLNFNFPQQVVRRTAQAQSGLTANSPE
jgi:uncharacterized protein YyaL (SSP411 family)